MIASCNESESVQKAKQKLLEQDRLDSLQYVEDLVSDSAAITNNHPCQDQQTVATTVYDSSDESSNTGDYTSDTIGDYNEYSDDEDLEWEYNAYHLPQHYNDPLLDTILISNKLNDSVWLKLSQELDYTERKNKVDSLPPTLNTNPSLANIPWDYFKKFLILGFILILVYVLFVLIKSSLHKRTLTEEYIISSDWNSDEPEDIDYPQFIEHSIQNKQYNLCVRLCFKHIIFLFIKKQLIQWRIDKTNQTYYRELKSNKHKHRFKTITILFERYWFGDKIIDDVLFEDYYNKYRDLLATLNDDHEE